MEYRLKSNTCTRRHTNKNTEKMTINLLNLISKKLSSQNTGNGFSGHQDCKCLGEKPPTSPSGTPNRCSCDSSVFKKYPSFTYSKGWTVCWSITYKGYPQTNLGTCDLYPVAMISLTSVASLLLETLINTWRSASPSSRQSAWKKKHDRRLRKATW